MPVEKAFHCIKRVPGWLGEELVPEVHGGVVGPLRGAGAAR